MRRRLFWFPLFAALVTANLPAGTIEFQVINLGSGMDRYVYTITGFTLNQHQEIDIQFDATMFSGLTNGQAGSDFNVVLLQPNNPMGAPGHYSAVAQVNSASLSGPFTVDFTFLGAGTPGAQPFAINQLDNNDQNITSVIATGTTMPLAVPEPATLSMAAAGLMAAAWRKRRSFRRTRR